MTSQRWQQIGDLFDAAGRLEPGKRDEWLHSACAGDDDLRAEVARLLNLDERADLEGLLTPPPTAPSTAETTVTWIPRVAGRLMPRGDRPSHNNEAMPVGGVDEFRPRPALFADEVSHPSKIGRASCRERV